MLRVGDHAPCAPVPAQWAYDWAFQSSANDGENSAVECTFAPDGAIYLIGGAAFDITLGTWHWPDQGSSACTGYLARLDSVGEVQWAHFLDQTNYCLSSYPGVTALSTDAAGNVFIGGLFNDSLQWDGALLLTDTANDPNNILGVFYMLKVDSSGTLLWSWSMSVGNGQFGDLEVDAAGMFLSSAGKRSGSIK
ncbi:MAG: hypothetical protein IPK99_09100 [Flavobacteriales bacterium]|nr:hypothetical protein [Flavobacteriales bacterium]